MADNYFLEGNYSEAEQIYLEAIEDSKTKFGYENLINAFYYENLAFMYSQIGLLSKQKNNLLKANAIKGEN